MFEHVGNLHSCTLPLHGVSSVFANTNSVGSYLVENLMTNGTYTVTPSKTGNNNGITAFDATLILRCVAAGNNCTLTQNQRKAADSDADNNVTAFDATQILRFVAANGQNANTGQTGNWKFLPNKRDYESLIASLSNQNFEVILIGHIDGEWMPPNSLTEGIKGRRENKVLAIVPLTQKQFRHAEIEYYWLTLGLPFNFYL